MQIIKKHKHAAILVGVLLMGILLLGYNAFAVGNEPGSSGDPLVTQSYVDKQIKWNVVELNTGQVLKGGAGSELILRRGRAVIVDSTGNGIPNVTSGVDLRAGSSVPVNNLLIVPREDGRGIKAMAPVVVMYRGTANVQ